MKIDDNSAIKKSEIKSNVDCMNENAKDSIDLSKFNSCHTNYVKQFNSFARKTAESAA